LKSIPGERKRQSLNVPKKGDKNVGVERPVKAAEATGETTNMNVGDLARTEQLNSNVTYQKGRLTTKNLIRGFSAKGREQATKGRKRHVRILNVENEVRRRRDSRIWLPLHSPPAVARYALQTLNTLRGSRSRQVWNSAWGKRPIRDEKLNRKKRPARRY